VRGQHHASAAPYPGKDPISIVQDGGLALGPVWTGAENLPSHRDSIPGPSSPALGDKYSFYVKYYLMAENEEASMTPVVLLPLTFSRSNLL